MTTGPEDQGTAATSRRGHLRASHADREHVIDLLKAAFEQGRLSKDEFDLRVGQTFASRTYAELATLTADIPSGRAIAAPQRHRGHRPGRSAAGVLAAIGSVGLVLLIALASGSTRSAGPVACSFTAMRAGAGPLPGGKKTTVAGAQSAAGFPVPAPDVTVASPANLTQVWVNDQAIALVYARGEITITMAPATYDDALTWFHTLITEIPAAAAIGRVNRQPALVITPDTDGCGINPAWVEFDRGGIDINVFSHHYGTNTLLAVADSMKPQVPWHPGHLPPVPPQERG